MHLYTVKRLAVDLQEVGLRLVPWGWGDMLKAERLPWGLWVMTDFDRIPAWWVEVAAWRFDLLRSAGMEVLNDPRRYLHRAAFLRQMRRAGLNSFDTWMPSLGEVPDRFPVFLRTILAHRGTLTEPLADAPAAAAALTAALAEGHALANLCFIEYRAAPMADGVFRKHAAYRVGNRIVGGLAVNDAGWHAKTGTAGAASDAFYAEERAQIADYPHAAAMRAAFDVAGMTWGRADFALVGGRVEVYEINTNPAIGALTEHRSPDRMESDRISRAGIAAALAALVRPCPAALEGGLPVPPDPSPLGRQP